MKYWQSMMKTLVGFAGSMIGFAIGGGVAWLVVVVVEGLW